MNIKDKKTNESSDPNKRSLLSVNSLRTVEKKRKSIFRRIERLKSENNKLRSDIEVSVMKRREKMGFSINFFFAFLLNFSIFREKEAEWLGRIEELTERNRIMEKSLQERIVRKVVQTEFVNEWDMFRPESDKIRDWRNDKDIFSCF